MSSVLEPVDRVAGRVERWVSFELDGQLFGLDVLEVQEVLRVPDITPTTGAPACVLGVINLRGNIVTVLDLRRRFGLPEAAPTPNSRVIILDLKPQQVGLAVDRVGEIMPVADSDVEAPPVMAAEPSLPVRKVLARNGALIFQIDTAHLLLQPNAVEQDLHAQS